MKTTTLNIITASRAAILATTLLAAQAVQANNSTWTLDGAGNFSDPLNWSDGVPGLPAGNSTSTDVATFGRSILGASRIVTFDEARNLGGITFENTDAVASRVFTVSAATAGGATPALDLSNGFVLQNIGSTTAVSGTNVLDVAMVLNGNASFTNTYGNSVVNIGISSGNSANSINAAAGLGNIDVSLGGSSTGSNLWSMRINQATGTTVRMVKEGTGFWQINGPAATAGNMTGGLLIRQGGVSLGRTNLPIGSGPIVFGDAGTTAGELYLQTGSGVTVNNNITVASSAATNVIIERLGTGGDSIYQGTITLERDLVLRQRTTGTARNLNIASNSVLTGTGNVIIDTTLASATGVVTLGGGSGAGTGSINMTGKLINQSSTGAAGVNVTGKILGNVTGVTQNSATSNMTLSNAANAYTGNTTVTAGTLLLTSGGTIGTSNLVLDGGILDIQGITGASFTLTANQTISGNGTIITTGKDLVLDGTLAPGASLGTINVTGNFTLGMASISNFAIDGTTIGDFDRLLASGVLTYDGTLNLSTTYAAQVGDTIKLFNGSSYAGAFDSITGTDLGGGLYWDTSDLAVDGTIVAAIPEPGTALLLGLGVAGLAVLRRRRS